MNNLYFLLIFCLFFHFSHSQEGISFKESKQLYLKGNSILIGNNILGKHPTKPLMNLNIPNDLVDMKYIDIDNDKTTFSSSEATILNAPENSTIKYAALYWAGLYPFKKGILQESANQLIHKGQGERDKEVNSILLKAPNGNYETVNGITIFDSDDSKLFKTNKPYVCYADITTKLQSLPSINGTFTIANIKATQGKISGGGSAGWLLYIVYEDTTQSPKYFNIYDGMVEVNKKAVDLNFKDFKSKEDGNVETTLVIGALEGDRKIKTDQVSVLDQKTGNFIPLHNKVREEKNFFNSSISIGDDFFNERNPNSANTLGFDLLKMEIPNKNNEVFDNTTNQANFKFQGKSDRFYLFFIAFETEINNSFLEEKTESINDFAMGTSLQQAQEIKSEEIHNTNAISTEIAQQEPISKDEPKFQEILKTSNSEEPIVLAEVDRLKSETIIKTFSVPGLAPGYYLVTNVFSLEHNALDWTKKLREKNYNPETFINPENKWSYVFIAKDIELKCVYEKWTANKDLAFFKDIWIAEINL